MSDAVDSGDVDEFIRSMQQDYGAARALNPEAVEKVRLERRLVSDEIGKIFGTLEPFLPDDTRFEAHVVDNVDVAQTVAVSDGRQLVLIGRHYIAFLRAIVELLISGVTTNADGSAVVATGLGDEEKALFGRCLGERLELGVPLSFQRLRHDHLGPDILVAATEFVIAHEVTHRLEAHEDGPDLTLTGFQDYCRLRGREYLCDQRAVGLLLLRRKQSEMPELAFLGAVTALLSLTWAEQFTPGFTPGGETHLHHPGSDSRLLRIHLEEPLFWRAAKLEGSPNEITGAVLRRAFRFMGACEREPKMIASPLNVLIRRATADGQQDHDLFERLVGELLARGRSRYVASALGSFWGSSELMRIEEHEDPTITDTLGTQAVPLFDRLHSRLAQSNYAAKSVAEEMAAARARRLEQSEAI